MDEETRQFEEGVAANEAILERQQLEYRMAAKSEQWDDVSMLRDLTDSVLNLRGWSGVNDIVDDVLAAARVYATRVRGRAEDLERGTP